MTDRLPEDYPRLLAEVRERVRSAQLEALRAVNAAYGAAVAERLAADLRAEFPGISGFSRRNVFYMREFYLCYRDEEKVQPQVAQIGWSHNRGCND